MSNTVTIEQVNEIMGRAEYDVSTKFDKCTVVSVQLPNGFVITESSGAVDKENYCEKIGFEICVERIRNKVWELEGYKLQNELQETN